MTVSSAGPLLFVVTRNHGSLIDAMLFLHGTELLDRSILLLPPELFAAHQSGLPARVRQYSSFDDLVRSIDDERPALVFLFCGYLLRTTELLTASQLKQLLRLLEERECPTVTNDPCWGLLASRVPMTSELPARTFSERIHRRLVELLIPHRLRQSYRILKRLVHCYPAIVDPKLSSEGLRTAAFFNDKLLGSFDHANAGRSDESWKGWTSPLDQPYWLFILASLDYEIQVNLHGRAAFIDSLVARMRDANTAGRRAVLIAPEDCLAAVRERGQTDDATLIGFCDYRQYVSLLLFAEYAFYWNIGSSSNLYRLFNSLPVFYFDRGHVSRWFDSFYERTVELLYRGHAPPMLDHREPLDPGHLRAQARSYRQSTSDIVRQLAELPSPEELVESITRGEALATARS